MERYNSIQKNKRTRAIKPHEYDFSGVLYEKTFNIKKDVDFIYNKFFKNFLKDLYTGEYNFYINIVKKFSSFKKEKLMETNDIIFGIIDSNELKSEDCKKANKLNQLNIYCGIFNSGNCYIPKVSSIESPYIQLSLSKNTIILFFNDYKGDSKNIKFYNNYLKENYIKSSIAHELSHWIDDSLHKGFLTSFVDLSEWLDDVDILKLKKEDVKLTYFEINAQIHGIENLKKRNKKKWNNFTLKDIFWEYTALASIAENIYIDYGEDILKIWQKYLLKRMARENLIGKNMRSFVNHKNLFETRFVIY